MSDIYHLDFETYSEQPLVGPKSVGSFRYASDPSTEILIMAIAKNDGPVLTWDCINGGADALNMFQFAVANGDIIYAHNAQFEHAVCRYVLYDTMDINIPCIEQWRCTATMARLAAIPSGLEKCAEFLKLDAQKDKEGERLIKKFSVPRKPSKKDPRSRIMPEDDPEDFQKFVDYCRQDVETERQIHKRLQKDFPLEGWALDSFRLDMEMNTRGIPVNVDALVYADSLMHLYLGKMIPKFRECVAEPGGVYTLPVTTTRKVPKDVDITEGFNPTQRELFMVWLANRGFTGTDLTAETQEAWLSNPGDLTDRGLEALRIYSLISSAAVKKIPAMLKLSCDDGMVRGGLKVFGAERTHRWTGSGIQPQNFARPKIKMTELAYDLICQHATLDEIESICGDFFDVLVSVIRHFIQPYDGEVLQADYSAIEARVAPWLVGEEKTLKAFEQGKPIYEEMASRIFGVPVDKVTQEQRFVGKQAVLGCTYNMGAPKFRGTCEGYGYEPSVEMVAEYKSHRKGTMESQEDWIDATYDDLAERAVSTWRENNPVVVQSWKDLDDAAKYCIQNPKKVKTVGKLKLCFKEVAGFDALLIKLPSGHKLVYPRAKVATRKGWGTEIQFCGVIPNTGGKWGWCSTYGGKLLENCTQAAAGDVMRHGMLCADRAGYKAFMLVHDEILTTAQPGQTHEELCDLLCEKADWMTGLPLAAEGARIPYYKK